MKLKGAKRERVYILLQQYPNSTARDLQYIVDNEDQATGIVGRTVKVDSALSSLFRLGRVLRVLNEVGVYAYTANQVSAFVPKQRVTRKAQPTIASPTVITTYTLAIKGQKFVLDTDELRALYNALSTTKFD